MDGGPIPVYFRTYVHDKEQSIVYKRDGLTWEIYYRKHGTKYTYHSPNLRWNKLRNNWIPVNVIKVLNSNLVVIIKETKQIARRRILKHSIGRFDNDTVSQVVCRFVFNKVELGKLPEKWNTQPITILCGSDGGLKNEIDFVEY